MATEIKITPLGSDYIRRFTEAYQAAGDDLYAREANCEAVQFPAVLVDPREYDYLAGKRVYAEIGYSVQYGGLGYYARPEHWDSSEDLNALRNFWGRESTAEQAYRELPASVTERVPCTFEKTYPIMEECAYTLYRMAGLQLDYSRLVENGLGGMQALLEERIAEADDIETMAFCKAGIQSLATVRRCTEHYIAKADAFGDNAPSRELAKALRGILNHAPSTFHEALELVLLVATITATNNFGRLDVVLGPILCRQLDEGSLTWAHALKLMQNFYTILEEEMFHTDARFCIGGMGRAHESEADRFAMLAMETTESLSLPLPQITLRFHVGQNPDLLNKAYDVIGKGKTFPMLYNDSVNVPAVEAAFRVDQATAQEYLPFGCGEYMISHQGCSTPNGIINLQRCLESAINHGRCLRTGKHIGPDYGGLADYADFESLWSAYARTIEYFTEPLAMGQASIYASTGKRCAFSLCSILYDDCIARGRPLFAGGIRYLDGSNETYGNVNAADSLTALKHLIYEEKTTSAAQLLTTLRDAWDGHEHLLKQAKDLPKYGNDHDEADAMLERVHQHMCVSNRDAGLRTEGLNNFLVVVINNNTNTTWGLETSASTDGRRHRAPLAPGNAPGAGCDRNGLTAVLNSQAKPDPKIHAGAVQNVKLSASFPNQNRTLYHTLFNTYFQRGGAQAMITVTNRDDLVAALEHPEKYANLLVRVGGFSARFIDLDTHTQQEILSRTEHS